MLVIATPLGGADVLCANVSQGYSEHVRALSHEMDAIQVVSYSGSHVHARNRLCAALLREFPDMTTTLWWDSDQWPEDRDLARKMLATGEDIVAAPTTTKERRPKFTHRGYAGTQPRGEVIDVAGVGFGYTMTSRRCLQQVSLAADVYIEDGQPVRNCFGHILGKNDAGENILMGEDFSFCHRWRSLGGKVTLFLNAGIMHHAGIRSFTARDIPGAYEETQPATAAE
jgi:hypothetical protein